MSTFKVDNIQSSNTSPSVFRNVNGTEIGQLCRAWCNFNGVSGSVAVRASFNISSVTRGGTAGYYLVGFTTSMTDANHSSSGSGQPNGYGGAYPGFGDTAAGTQTASRSSIETRDSNNAASDTNFIQMTVHR